MTFLRALLVVPAVLAATGASAARAAGEKTPLRLPGRGDGGSAASSQGPGLIRLFVGMLVVVGVILAVRWLLKTYAKSKFPGLAAAAGTIEIVATKPLAPNRALHVVRLGDETLLIGSTEQAITALRALSAEESERLYPPEGNHDFARTLEAAAGARPAEPRGRGTQWGGFRNLVGALRERTVRG